MTVVYSSNPIQNILLDIQTLNIFIKYVHVHVAVNNKITFCICSMTVVTVVQNWLFHTVNVVLKQLMTSYDKISLKANEYPDICSLDQANIRIPKTAIRCSPNSTNNMYTIYYNIQLTVTQVGTRSHLFNRKTKCLWGFSLHK